MTVAVLQLLFGERHRLTSTPAYLLVGWLVFVALVTLVSGVPKGSLWLLMAGALCHLAGAGFYLWRRLRYQHAVWHTCVLGGSTGHFLAVLLFLLPQPG